MGKEIWDAYYADGTPAGQDLIRGEDLPKGLYHIVCEVLVRHADGEYLLMQRDLEKEGHPGEWEASAGGSALKGEDRWQCIRRELREETGISCTEFVQVAQERYEKSQALFYCFVCQVDCDKDTVQLQEGETIDYRWVSEPEFRDFIANGELLPGQKRRYMPYYIENGLWKA